MKWGSVRLRVYLVALILTLVPTAGGWYALQEILDSAVGVGLSPKISQELENAGNRLKELSRRDPQQNAKYRAEFETLQQTRSSYDLLMDLRSSLHSSYLLLFLITLGAAGLIAFTLAYWLNRKIIQTHEAALIEMKTAQARAHQLESRESWKVVAQKLVHEVKNPLTPIQMTLGRLRSKAKTLPPAELQSELEDAALIVDEEVQKISQWVEAFAQFAQMPEARPVQVNLKTLIEKFVDQNADRWENCRIRSSFEETTVVDAWSIDCDPVQVRQVFSNLVKNSAEAAGTCQVNCEIEASVSEQGTPVVSVRDNGSGIAPFLRSKLFSPFSSSKTERGRGLGLAICRKIMLEQGGDLIYLPSDRGCHFRLIFAAKETE